MIFQAERDSLSQNHKLIVVIPAVFFYFAGAPYFRNRKLRCKLFNYFKYFSVIHHSFINREFASKHIRTYVQNLYSQNVIVRYIYIIWHFMIMNLWWIHMPDLHLLDRKIRKMSRSNNESAEKSTKRKTHDRNMRKCSNVINVSMVNKDPLQMNKGQPHAGKKGHHISLDSFSISNL